MTAVVSSAALRSAQPRTVTPQTVHEVLADHLLVDGFDMVLDLAASQGSTLVDARDGTAYLDLFTFFASSRWA
jgi:L-lysine 6-transaminase